MGVIVGRVVGQNGQPVADAVAMVSGDSPSHQDIAALTDENGEFRLADLAAGEYTILVNTEGGTSQSKQTHVDLDGTSYLDFCC